jgi:hypothetical protein
VSWVFPVGAGLGRDTSAFPKWWGPVDVVLAFVLAILAFGIQMEVRGKLDREAEEKIGISEGALKSTLQQLFRKAGV